MAEKQQENGKESCEKDLLHKALILLWLGKVSKPGTILSENGRPEIFAESGRFSSQNGRVGISVVMHNFGQVNKVHYGLCENCEYKTWFTPVMWPTVIFFEHDF